jgi:hypothetical protein
MHVVGGLISSAFLHFYTHSAVIRLGHVPPSSIRIPLSSFCSLYEYIAHHFGWYFTLLNHRLNFTCHEHKCWSLWPRGLRRGSATFPLLGFWVRIPPEYGCLSWVLGVVRYRYLFRADHSSSGVLSNVVCPMNVVTKPRKGRGQQENKNK